MSFTPSGTLVQPYILILGYEIMLSLTQKVKCHIGVSLMNTELASMWTEAVVTYFVVLRQHFPGRTYKTL